MKTVKNLNKYRTTVLSALGFCLIFAFCACETTAHHEDSDRGHQEGGNEAELQEESSVDDLLTGEWTEKTAGNKNLKAAFAYLEEWYVDEGSALPGLPKDEKAALLSGGAIQVVEGLNLRLDIRTASDRDFTVYLYRDFSANYMIEEIQSKGEIIYRGE